MRGLWDIFLSRRPLSIPSDFRFARSCAHHPVRFLNTGRNIISRHMDLEKFCRHKTQTNQPSRLFSIATSAISSQLTSTITKGIPKLILPELTVQSVIDQFHPNWWRIICCNIPKAMSSRHRGLARFVALSSGPSPLLTSFWLQICGKLCPSSSSFSKHWRKHHLATHGPQKVLKTEKPDNPTDPRIFRCDICDFKSAFKQHLTKHKEHHLTMQECTICRRPYSKRFMAFHAKTHSPNFGKTPKKHSTKEGLFKILL